MRTSATPPTPLPRRVASPETARAQPMGGAKAQSAAAPGARVTTDAHSDATTCTGLMRMPGEQGPPGQSGRQGQPETVLQEMAPSSCKGSVWDVCEMLPTNTDLTNLFFRNQHACCSYRPTEQNGACAACILPPSSLPAARCGVVSAPACPVADRPAQICGQTAHRPRRSLATCRQGGCRLVHGLALCSSRPRPHKRLVEQARATLLLLLWRWFQARARRLRSWRPD